MADMEYKYKLSCIDDLTEEEFIKLRDLLRLFKAITEEEEAALEHRIPMSLELFESCFGKFFYHGAHNYVKKLIDEYPDLLDECAKKVEEGFEKSEFKDCKISKDDAFLQKILNGNK